MARATRNCSERLHKAAARRGFVGQYPTLRYSIGRTRDGSVGRSIRWSRISPRRAWCRHSRRTWSPSGWHTGAPPGPSSTKEKTLSGLSRASQNPCSNGVFRTRLAPDAVESAIATTLAHLASRRVPMFWWVGPFTRPPDLGTHLERYGLTRAANLPAMAVDLRTLPEEPPSIPGVVVAPVEDLETLRTWARVAAIGTGFPEPFHQDLVTLEAGVGLEPPERFCTRYIAY